MLASSTLNEFDVVFGELKAISSPRGGAVSAKIAGRTSAFDIDIDEGLEPRLRELKGQKVAVTRIGGRDYVTRWHR